MATANRIPQGDARRRARAIGFAAAGFVLLLAAAATGTNVAASATAQSRVQSSNCSGARATVARSSAEGTLDQTRTVSAPTPRRDAGSYGWPLRPFDRQHPVRAFFNDPRIGDGGTHAFHFGIDISAPDGTPVYAVEAGTVYIEGGRAVAVLALDGSRTFGYWHIVPAVKSHQFVHLHQLLGHIDKGWEHVHFAERTGGKYVNPLRPGALGPYADRMPPTVEGVDFVPTRQGVEIVADAYDMPQPRVAGEWADEPVTPALVSWRIVGVTRWRNAVDFRSTLLDARRFWGVYAPSTRQNHKGEAGLYCFYLARAWRPASVRDGSYRLQIAATDTRGNRAVATTTFTVAKGTLR
jgi:hypothetical protein